MITDEIKIKVSAGKGGNGVVNFDKTKMALGPTGGKGGWGGSFYFKGVSNLTALNKYRNKKDYYAGDGQDGASNRSTGHDGADLFLTVPVGSVIKNLTTQEETDIIEEGQIYQAAKGGIGGRGNFYFRSPINTSPQEFETGKPGEQFEFLVELRLIADIGLVGLPNAGKSSLLNELTNAEAKVADYQFTTLEPNLGAMDRLIIADIPGLIEGASRGKGLGIKFLKHIQRTKFLVQCISAESKDWEKDYKVVKKELRSYNKVLADKEEMLLLTKADLLEKNSVEKIVFEMKKKGFEAYPVSILDDESLKIIRSKFISHLIN